MRISRASYPLAIAFILAPCWPASAASTPDNYVGPDGGNWSDLLNWSAGLPAAGKAAILDSPSALLVNLNVNATLDSVTLDALHTLFFQPAKTLTLTAGITNDGTLSLTAGSALFAKASFQLSGAGVITLDGSSITGSNSISLTSNLLISGNGTIGSFGGSSALFTNNSTITASTGILSLALSNDFVDYNINNGTLRADGGTLSLDSGLIQNNGLIESLANSAVYVNTLVRSGTISANGGAVFLGFQSGATVEGTLTGPMSAFHLTLNNAATNNGTLTFAAAGDLSLTANAAGGTVTLVNHGLINLVNSVALRPVLLTGAGTIALAGSMGASSFNSPFITDNLITGHGVIGTSATIDGIPLHPFTLINNGTIVSTSATLSIVPGANSVNNGTLRADGGVLALTSSGLTQVSLLNTGVIEAAAGSAVTVFNTSITGGVIRALPGGTVTLQSAAVTNASFSGFIRATNSGFSSTTPFAGTMANAGTLDLGGTFHTLTFNAAGTQSQFSLVNTGLIRLFPLNSITLNADTLLSGGGSVTLATGLSTASPFHRLTTDNIITGSGGISAPITNSGSIIATTGTLSLSPFSGASPSVNLGLLRADGGTLRIDAGTLDNSAGILEADNASTLAIAATVTGGTLRAMNNATIDFYSTASVGRPNTASILTPILLTNASVTAHVNAQTQSITGPGTVTIGPGIALTSGALTTTSLIINGFQTITPRSPVSKVSRLSLAHANAGTAAVYTSMLQLNDNRLIVQSTGSADKAAKLLALNEALFAGHNGTANSWSSTQGITSSTVAADPKLTIGVFDNAALHRTNFAGGTNNADDNSLLLSPALKGDANLDGIVNFNDMLVVTGNWNLSGLSNGISTIDMAHGDLNGDGVVNFNDMLVVTGNWNNSSSQFNLSALLSDASPLPYTNFQLPASPIPEPASLGLLAIPLLLKKGRCRPKARTRG